MQWDARQIALIREAAISGNLLSVGLSALKKTNFTKLGLYGEGFFSLSMGLERLLKIVCLLDWFITNNRFPSDQEMRCFGRDIEDLFARVDDIRQKHKVRNDALIPPDSIEHELFRYISNFSMSTMYFNMDFFTAGPKAGRSDDPVSEWFDPVASKIFAKHLLDKQRAKISHHAALVDELTENLSLVGMKSSIKAKPQDIEAAQQELNKVLQKYVAFYCARICRYLYEILVVVTRAAQSTTAAVEIPSLDGLFFPFETDDASLLSRKTFPMRA